MGNSLFEVQAVSKYYKQNHQNIFALKEVSLVIDKRDIYGIIGLSGAGKSTLIRCLAGLVSPSSGHLLFQGQDIHLFNKESLRGFRKNIGMIFQHFNLLSSRTVFENVEYPLEITNVPKETREKRINELLELVGLQNKKDNYPSRLSGGEKQRVGIARALANAPQVLLCDEATSALDPKTTKEILALLKRINEELGVTIVLITHEMDVVKYLCNKVAVIEKGKIIEEGLVSKIFADPEHITTKNFLQNASHDIPAEFFQDSNRMLLRLRFKGNAAGEPIISEIVKRFDVHANILLGWVDRLQNLTLGTLVIALTGSKDEIDKTLKYFEEKAVQYEVIKNV
ncbi:MAG: ATP-binding cassette domain-containing protein [Chlamydiota bacterium]